MGEKVVWLTLIENIALSSLLLNFVYLFLKLEVIILDLGPENLFVKKGNRNTSVQQDKISTVR